MSDDVSLTGPAFPPEEFRQRRRNLLAAMAERELPVLVVTAPEDIYYLTGYNNQGHFAFTALVVAADGEPVLVARAMEAPTAAAQVPDCAFDGYGDDADPAAVLSSTIKQAGGPQEAVGYQGHSMTFPIAVWNRVRDSVPAQAWIDCTDLLVGLRAVHSDRELACIEAAARLSDLGMQAALDAVGAGVPEAEVAAAGLHAMIRSGSDYPGFVPLVRTMDRVDQEHLAWSTRRLRDTDTVFLELSAAVARYHAPLTRTVAVAGPPRSPAAAEIALVGHAAIRAAIRPGRTAEDIYRAWRDTVDADLGAPNDRHHCGYLIGIGFPPSWVGGNAVLGLRPGNTTVLRPGMTFYIQSWVIKQQVGDHVVCDTVLVTEDGCELLTTTSRGEAP
ncbi:M24 family metallopeptidase [Myceligenerans salitolerans]|uniref:Aminopeptidase P family protein n=1 Tax=Myceligenerans salitolerans TaxID=1230528 RepID=A0ABS3IEU1_9MICO|nr:Xaa-Pro peptidase family protein [Myceligenerans salitolerans]MBO0610532.1 aminopeptidase P family protein [Myceligenerans salitolerans]